MVKSMDAHDQSDDQGDAGRFKCQRKQKTADTSASQACRGIAGKGFRAS